MKKLIFSIMLCAALISNAQQKSPLTDQSFWKSNPSLTQVKAEVAKGFDFKNVEGSDDPVFQSVSNKASLDIIKYLVEQPGVNLSRTIHEGRILLHSAANDGNVEVADYLISKGSDMNFVDANGHTPLTFAAFQGKLTPQMADVFIKHGLDIKKKYEKKEGATLLLLAIGSDKDFTLTDYFISKGLSLKDTDANGKNAFFYASRLGNVDILKELVKRGVEYDNTALIAASQGTYRSANKVDVYKYLVEDLKLDPKVTSAEGQTLLHLVTKKQNQDEVISYLLSKGVDASKVDEDGNTAFITAAGGKSIEAVKVLFPSVKDINAANANGETALLNAVKSSTGEIVKFLIQNGANVNATDKDGNGAAYILVDSYRVPRGRGGFGGTPQGGNAQGRAPQGQARPAAPQQDDFAIKLDALQAKGLDFTKTFKDGETVFHVAADKGDVNILKKIAGVKADINAQDKDGNTALHKAALVAKNDESLKYLVSLGADKSIKTEFGETAYDLAKENEILAKDNVSIEFLK